MPRFSPSYALRILHGGSISVLADSSLARCVEFRIVTEIITNSSRLSVSDVLAVANRAVSAV